MAIITRPLSPKESDLLLGFEFSNLIVTDLNRNTLKVYPPPPQGWSHEALEGLEAGFRDELNTDGWQVFLGDFKYWIGSSEV